MYCVGLLGFVAKSDKEWRDKKYCLVCYSWFCSTCSNVSVSRRRFNFDFNLFIFFQLGRMMSLRSLELLVLLIPNSLYFNNKSNVLPAKYMQSTCSCAIMCFMIINYFQVKVCRHGHLSWEPCNIQGLVARMQQYDSAMYLNWMKRCIWRRFREIHQQCWRMSTMQHCGYHYSMALSCIPNNLSIML